MSKSTLVTGVTVHQPDAVVHRNDVPVRIEQHGTHHMMEFTTRDLGVTVRLTDGERIALIEALGGTA
jgi:hypothetical protein